MDMSLSKLQETEGQGSLGRWSPRGLKQLDTAKQLNNSKVAFATYGLQPPGSSGHGILQAGILERLPCPLAGDLPDPGSKLASLMFPASADRFFSSSATWETHNWQNTGWVLDIQCIDLIHLPGLTNTFISSHDYHFFFCGEHIEDLLS